MKAATALHTAKHISPGTRAFLIAALSLAFLAGMAIAPIPVPPYLDFQVLYHADLGLLRGIGLYDHGGQAAMIAQLAQVPVESVYVLPFPYPPWYALSTLWLAWLPIGAAARVWFGIGLVLLLASGWLLTEGWMPMQRVGGMLAAVFFLPVLGSLLVGQYGFPVLLGCALMVYALKNERPGLAALAAALLTFKPHLGGLMVLGVLVYLWQRHNAFGRRAMACIAGVGAVLFLAGFLADRAWPIDYVRSLGSFQQDPGVASCDLCASLPVYIAAKGIPGRGLPAALVMGAVLLAALLVFWGLRRRRLLQEPSLLIAAAILTVLVASPYLLNYDFMLLLVPLAVLLGVQRGVASRLLLTAFYALPMLSLGILGRQGNFILPLCALGLLIKLARDVRPLDGSHAQA